MNPPPPPAPPRSPSPAALLVGAVACLLAGVFVFGHGMFAGGMDVREACEAAGAPYDAVYREQHWLVPGRLFPLSNPCNAGQDLVAWWVNPAVVVLALGTLGFLVAAAVRARRS